MEAATALATLTTDFVSSVYSGKPGCACGCRGNHRYNSKHVEAASADRGYAVTPDEVNNTQVRKVLAKLQANPALLEEWEPGDNNFGAVIDGRLYIVYPTAAYVNMVRMAAMA